MATESKSDYKQDEKSQIVIGLDDDDTTSQGTIVNEKDERQEANKFKIENTNIRDNIGILISEFIDKNNNKITIRGTATVFKVYDGYSHIITSASNIRKTTFECNKCNEQNEHSTCDKCGQKQLSIANISNANNIYFERRNIETGKLEQKYNCDMNNIYINDIQYKRFPSVSNGYDIAMLTFEDDGFYKQKCRDIILVNGKLFSNIKDKTIPYFIFGYPQLINKKENEQLYGGQSNKNELQCIRNKYQRYYLKQYEIDTSIGTQGAPIFSVVKGPDEFFYTLIFAVHTGGKIMKYNVGTLLDKNIDYLKIINKNSNDIKSLNDIITDTIESMDKYDGFIDSLDKSMSKWSYQSLLTYLNVSIYSKNIKTSKIKKAMKQLMKLAKNEKKCIEILQFEPLDILFNIIQKYSNKIDIQMIAISVIGVLCIFGFAKEYPSNVNGIYDISKAMICNLNNAKFVAFSCASVGSFCGINDNNIHISMVVQTDIIQQIIKVMNYYRDKDEGYMVNKAACQALKNIANESNGAIAVGPKGVESIIESINVYKNKNDIVEHSMQALFNLSKIKSNCECMIKHKMLDLIFRQIQTAKIGSLLFLWIFTVLSILLHYIPKDDKPKAVQIAVEGGILLTLKNALQNNSEKLQELSVSMIPIIAKTSANYAKQVVNAGLPKQLVKICKNNQTKTYINNCIETWFYVCNVFGSQKRFIDNGIIEFLTSDWYKNIKITDPILKIVCQLYVELLFRYNGNAFAPYYKRIKVFCKYCRKNKQLVEKVKVIEESIKNLKNQW